MAGRGFELVVWAGSSGLGLKPSAGVVDDEEACLAPKDPRLGVGGGKVMLGA